MPRELVTRSSRFYCVSLVPDICKTPIGAATPPIPYMIKAEFADASGVSKNIRSNGEYVVIHASTVIPTVTGDEAGAAKGIKSGTVGKRVQHDEKSSTVSFNGERAIRAGDTVYMNDKNTTGKVLERGGGGGAAALKTSFAAAANAADKLAAKVESASRIGAVRKLKDDYRGAIDQYTEMVANALPDAQLAEIVTTGTGLSKAMIDMIPESLLDLFGPGRSVRAAREVKGAAGVAKGVVKPISRPAKPPAKGSDGGKSKGKGGKEKKDKPSNCCPKNTGPGGKAVSSRHPVHFGTGEEVLQQTDFVLGGALPIVWTRCYRSGSECENWSVLGARWASPFTAHISVARQGIVYHDDTGRALRLPPLAIGALQDNRAEGFTLARSGEHVYELTWRDGSRDLFTRHGMAWLPHGHDGVNAMLPPAAPEQCEQYVLYRSEGADGRGYSIARTIERDDPVLLTIASDDGRVVEAVRAAHDPHLIGHVEEVRADGTRIRHVAYAYESAPETGDTALPRCHNLVSQADRTGATRRYRYAHHLLVAYTTYGGFEHGLEWASLAALRARWAGSPCADEQLSKMHAISAENSYQARAVATRTADGRDEVLIRYLDEDTTRVTEAGGAVFDYTFDENWLCTHVARVPADGGLPRSLGRRRWDADGMLLEESDALHNTWFYQYDAAGNLSANTDAEGHATRIAYDVANQPVSITDCLGNATHYKYDGSGNLVSVTNALGYTTAYEYDQRGRVVAIVDAKGSRTAYEYDVWGNLVAHTDCSGYRSTYRYDQDGNLLATCDALGNETAYRHDDAGQPTIVTRPDGTQEHYAYDTSGNLITHTDALGYQTHYRYDGHDMPVERIDALGHSVKYRYDSALRMAELINGNGESYRFSYTQEGWLDSETGYDGKVTRYHYDRAGELMAYESCGIRIDLTRDRMGRLIWKTTPDGITRYRYDALGRLVSVVAPHAENGFRYDALGQLLEEHSAYFISEPHPTAYKLRRVPDHYFVMRYAYDELGDRIQTILPDGHRIDVLRYGSGHWHGVLWDGEPIVDVERDRLHRERRRQIGAPSLKLVATRTYDRQSRIATMVLKRETIDTAVRPLRERAFSYDAVGNLLSIRHGWHTRDETLGEFRYQYDALGNLLSASTLRHREVFHNLDVDLATLRRPQQCTEVVANCLNPPLLHSISPKVDAMNTASDIYVFDAENRLSSVTTMTLSSSTSFYLYDGLARRVAKITDAGIRVRTEQPNQCGANITWFAWDGDTLASEISTEGVDYYLFEPSGFTPLAKLVYDSQRKADEPEKYFYHCDHLGTPQEVVDKNANIIWKINSTAWGDDYPSNSAPQRIRQPLRFPGQYRDIETGLHYNRHRYYNPKLGRYISPDPYGVAAGLDLFAYAPNPVGWTDPLGLTKCRLRPKTAAEEIASLPKFCNLRPCDIRKVLKSRKYSMVGSRKNVSGSNTGGQVWTKGMPDDHTAAVRIDPAESRANSTGRAPFADEVPHAHKEIVPSDKVVNGNYGFRTEAGTKECTDTGLLAGENDHFGKHIAIKNGRLIKPKRQK